MKIINVPFKGENGISIEIVKNAIEQNIIPRVKKERPKTKKSVKFGVLKTTDWEAIEYGVELLRNMYFEGYSLLRERIISGDHEISKIKKDLYLYMNVISNCISRLDYYTMDISKMQKEIERIGGMSEILDAARDGVLLKQATRIDTIDGVKREVKYDTNYTVEEIKKLFDDFYMDYDINRMREIDTYITIGMGVAGVLGTIFKKDDVQTKDYPFLTLSTIAMSGVKLLLQYKQSNKDDRGKAYELKNEKYGAIRDFLDNEHIDYEEEQELMQNIKNLSMRINLTNNKIENKKFMEELFLDVLACILCAKYVNSQVLIRPDGKIDPKSLSKALINLESTKEKARRFVDIPEQLTKIKQEKLKIEQSQEERKDILRQYKEKVVPLKGVEHHFNSLKMEHFDGIFHEQYVDYSTGEKKSMRLVIPNFSLKSGEVALLTGESGNGKSTFLTFLKSGDIQNRNAIIIDDKEKVDKIGKKQCSVFQKNMKLGDGTNVLFQLTGKTSVSALTEKESSYLLNILSRLKFDPNTILDELAEKRFSVGFSDGQKARLVFTNLLCRINKTSNSIVYVDEPGEGVEEELVREEFKMLVEIAKRKNLMVVLTTHRINLAEDLVSKRYNLENGVVQEVPLKKEIEK